MDINPVKDQIQLHAKMLKIPTFSNYADVVRRMRPDQPFEAILLELMRVESAQRQENQNVRRLKSAGFPFHKTLDELDVSRYEGTLSETFLASLPAVNSLRTERTL